MICFNCCSSVLLLVLFGLLMARLGRLCTQWFGVAFFCWDGGCSWFNSVDFTSYRRCIYWFGVCFGLASVM